MCFKIYQDVHQMGENNFFSKYTLSFFKKPVQYNLCTGGLTATVSMAETHSGKQGLLLAFLSFSPPSLLVWHLLLILNSDNKSHISSKILFHSFHLFSGKSFSTSFLSTTPKFLYISLVLLFSLLPLRIHSLPLSLISFFLLSLS